MRRFALILVVCLSLLSRDSAAQLEPLTVGSILLAGGELKKALDGLSSSLGGTAAQAANNFSAQLTLQMQQLEAVVEGNVTAPLTALRLEARVIADGLNGAIERANQLISMQRQCATQDLYMLTAALKTVTLALKDVLPFAQPGSPRADYFQFDGHLPSVVPSSGGRVVFHGHRLWSELTPTVTVTSSDGTSHIFSAQAQNGASDDEASFVLHKEIAAGHPEQCLQVKLTLKERHRFLFFRWGEKISHELVLPMCVPSVVGRRMFLSASMDYSCPRVEESDAAPQGWLHRTMSDCNRTDCYSDTQRWQLPDNCSIVSIREVRKGDLWRYVERDPTGNISFTRDSVTVSGCLSARCLCAPIAGCRRLSHGEYQLKIFPRVRCNMQDSKQASVRSAVVEVSTESSSACVDLPKECSPAHADVQLALHEVYGEGLELVLHRWPRVTVASSIARVTASFGKISATPSFNLGAAARAAQACVELRSESCRY